MSKTAENLEHKRHTLAHLLAAAVVDLYPDTLLTLGPAIDDGFYYDLDFVAPLKDTDLPAIEKKMKEILKEWTLAGKKSGGNPEGKSTFIHKEVSVKDARMLFEHNPYKLELIEEIEKRGEKITLYTIGDGTDHLFTDLCRGGHSEDVSEISPDSFKLSRLAGAYWRGSEKNKMLTRIYGLAFDTKEDLKAHEAMRAEAEKRDHKKLGRELKLLMFHETAPGMPYWLPNGLVIYRELEQFWRDSHTGMNYQEIMSPLINKSDLWKISGHWDHYKDDMFIADMGENEVYGIKPMNCPNAMLVFKSMQVSYKDFPLRLSDTDRLHRYERSGTLNGLLRCRSFQQDDSHNFITEDLIGSEYEHIMEVCKNFYGIFGLQYKFRLGTMPESHLGDVETWNKAEAVLKKILEKSGVEYSIAEGDGAFYGPKVDIVMKDCLGRDWQMGTMQLDFQLPQRFELEYTDKDGKKKTPVVIHRVIYGSLERFIGILIEHFAGAFPLWLSPVQATIVPIGERQHEYAQKVFESLKKEGIRVEVDLSSDSLGKKIRNAKTAKVPYVLVVGDKEVEANTITLESRTGNEGALSVEALVERLQKEISSKSL